MKLKRTRIRLMMFLISLVLGPVLVHAGESREFADKVAREHGLNASQSARLKSLLTSSILTRNIGDENPASLIGPNHSYHPASRAQCVNKVLRTGLIKQNPRFEKICGAKWMSPVPRAGTSIDRATVCIDQFEFPDLPCEYPVAWVTAPTEEKICQAMGKRVCNADEWEGACAGQIDAADTYFFGAAPQSARSEHNRNREVQWAYQFIAGLKNQRDSRSTCGVFSKDDPEISAPMRQNLSKYYDPAGKSAGCDAANAPTKTCGTNTWPAGFKNACRSLLDVYDMHGNLAESVNLPTSAGEVARNGNPAGGLTEHKGSFFVYRAQYPDDCRVRQPYEHNTSFHKNGMAFYQEGFRCCKDVRN